MQQSRKQLPLGHRHMNMNFIFRPLLYKGRINSRDELGKTFIVRLVMRHECKDGYTGSSSGRIMRLVPVFMLETRNQTSYKIFAQVHPDE